MAIISHCFRFGVDRIGWKDDPKRAFTISSAYSKILCEPRLEVDDYWCIIWRLKVPQRIRSFLWLAMRGNLLTNAECRQRHMTLAEECDICHNGAEDVNHILRESLGAAVTWIKLVRPDRVTKFFSMPFRDWFAANLCDQCEFVSNQKD
ncbi:hypothetical protein GQ457_02G034900 [Hibiscus cannabinus]